MQGADTNGETSFLIDLLCRAEVPVILTGAMRHPGLPGADGPANIVTAVRPAAGPLLSGLGCLMALADELRAVRYVRKAHTTSIAAFCSPSAGPVGHVLEGTIRPLARPARRTVVTRDAAAPAGSGRTGDNEPGDDGELLRVAAARNDGLVAAGFGQRIRLRSGSGSAADQAPQRIRLCAGQLRRGRESPPHHRGWAYRPGCAASARRGRWSA